MSFFRVDFKKEIFDYFGFPRIFSGIYYANRIATGDTDIFEMLKSCEDWTIDFTRPNFFVGVLLSFFRRSIRLKIYFMLQINSIRSNWVPASKR